MSWGALLNIGYRTIIEYDRIPIKTIKTKKIVGMMSINRKNYCILNDFDMFNGTEAFVQCRQWNHGDTRGRRAKHVRYISYVWHIRCLWRPEKPAGMNVSWGVVLGIGYRTRIEFDILYRWNPEEIIDTIAIKKTTIWYVRFRYLQHYRIFRTRRRKMHGNARGRKATHVRDIYGYLRYIESSIYRKISYDILSVRHLDIPKLSILCIERSILHISIYRNFLYIRYPTLL